MELAIIAAAILLGAGAIAWLIRLSEDRAYRRELEEFQAELRGDE